MAAVYTMLSIAAGVFLYWFRSRLRFWYGVVELIAAIAAIIVSFIPHTNYLLLVGGSPLLPSLMANTTTLLAGIYVFVRGMDNMGQDLPASWKPAWRRIFG